MSFFQELKRRNVFRVVMAYLVAAWLLLQFTDVVLNNTAAPGWVFSFIMVLLGIGLVLAVIFAWAFELTPEGLKLEREVDRTQSITHRTGRRLDFIIIGVLSVALAWFAWDKFGQSPDQESGPAVVAEPAAPAPDEAGETSSNPETVISAQSIAVLPFVNMSSDPEQEYFADGLSEELLNLLAKIQGLSVAARTSSFSLKGKELQISEVADILKVAHVLEGSVRKSGDRIRVTAQLIQADNGYHLWSETYDRDQVDIFAIQDEIAAHVVEELRVTLMGEVPHAPETDPELYARFLYAKQLYHRANQESVGRAAEIYQEILVADPDFAQGWSALGRSQVRLNGWEPSGDHLELAADAFRHAVEIDPDMAEAWSGLAFTVQAMDNDLQRSADLLAKAWAIDPNDLGTLNAVALFLMDLGRLEAARPFLQRLLQRDPISEIALNNLSIVDYALENFEASQELALRAIELNPEAFGGHFRIAMNYLFMEQHQNALLALEQEPFDGWRWIGEAIVQEAMGERARSDRALQQLIDAYSADAMFNIAYIHANRGDIDQAFKWLEDELETNGPGMFNEINSEPLFAPLYDDPRWDDFLARIGRSPEQLGKIVLDVTPPGP